MEEEFADLIREVLGSKEAVQAVMQGTEYAMVRANTDVWSHFWGSVRRKREGIQIAWWEAIGGVIYNRLTKNLEIDTEQVPPELHQRALSITKAHAVPGRLPQFDQKVFGTRYTYRVAAAHEGHLHVLAFYRRPKYWIFP